MEPILRTTESIDWMTLVIFSSLLFMVLAKRLFYHRFMNFIILPFNNKYIVMYNKKEKLMNWFHIFFSIFQIINFSLFLFYVWNLLWPSTSSPYPYMFPVLLACVLLFLLLKVLLQLGNGFIFGSNKMISEILFKKLSYLNYSAIIMFLANIVLTYISNDSKTIVFVAIFLILLVNGIGWATVLRNHQKFIAHNFFYFILYLCALEIAPFIIIGSYLKH